jgi:Fe-S-cluster containining protein
MSKYECDQCGACCTKLIVEIEELDVIREPRLIGKAEPFRQPPGTCLVDEDGEPAEEIVPGYGGGAMLACGATHPCPMLGADNLCTIYPSRPNVCVSFQAGSDQCRQARGMAGLPPLEPKPTEDAA